MSESVGTRDGNLDDTATGFGYRAMATPQNLCAFDPKWLKLAPKNLLEELRNFRNTTEPRDLKIALDSYCDFIEAKQTGFQNTFKEPVGFQKSKSTPY